MERIYDLEDRLVDYTCRMIDVVEALPKTRSGIAFFLLLHPDYVINWHWEILEVRSKINRRL